MDDKPSRTAPPQQRTQLEAFRDLARELECDENEEAFDAKLKRLVKRPREEGLKPPKKT